MDASYGISFIISLFTIFWTAPYISSTQDPYITVIPEAINPCAGILKKGLKTRACPYIPSVLWSTNLSKFKVLYSKAKF